MVHRRFVQLTTACASVFLINPTLAARSAGERVHINDNRTPAGVLKMGVLTLNLDARVATWHPDADDGPGIDVQGFAEVGHTVQIPGPLIRVVAGTTVDISIKNSVNRTTLEVHGLLSRVPMVNLDTASIKIPFGATQRKQFRLDVPGTYYYWGTTSGRRFGNRIHEDAQLTGAIVVDEPSTSVGGARRPDRIFVIGMMSDTTGGENVRKDREHLLFVVNGKSWPHTERLNYAMGDTIRWRVLNATVDPHPMHLHGAYYRVESRGNGNRDSTFATAMRDQVNTELLDPGSTMMMSWSPVHAGNWLFHCHIPEHFGPRGPLGVLPSSARVMSVSMNHALQGMSGLVMGVTIRSSQRMARSIETERRHLRLVIDKNVGTPTQRPYYSLTLDEGAVSSQIKGKFRAGPIISLVRGKPVDVMVVNLTDTPTSIHWHGIELESYFDGVSGFSGIEKRISPVVAPRDSFEARFTPPRTGTFMYHTHVDEAPQQRMGLAGLLLVLEPRQATDMTTDFPILISSPADDDAEARHVLINGNLATDTLYLSAGDSYRFRFGNITTGRPGMHVEVRDERGLTSWTPLAKDGAELPAFRRIEEPATHRISIGETMDFRVTPTATGQMNLNMVTAAGTLLGRVAIRVR
ncbi:MAG: multicopper oxidase domain-containing protein [Gemmatimonadales bacterium]